MKIKQHILSASSLEPTTGSDPVVPVVGSSVVNLLNFS